MPFNSSIAARTERPCVALEARTSEEIPRTNQNGCGGCIMHVPYKKPCQFGLLKGTIHTYATSLEPALYLSPFRTDCTDEPYARISISLSLAQRMMDNPHRHWPTLRNRIEKGKTHAHHKFRANHEEEQGANLRVFTFNKHFL